MRAMTRRAMEDGALGVGTGLIYPPGAYATTDELVEIAKVVHGWGGVYISHIRSESYGLLDALQEAIEIGERSGVPVEIYHLKAAGQENWNQLEPAIRLIEAARARGCGHRSGHVPLHSRLDQLDRLPAAVGVRRRTAPEQPARPGRPPSHDL